MFRTALKHRRHGGFYPERTTAESGLDQIIRSFFGRLAGACLTSTHRFAAMVGRVNALGASLEAMSDGQLAGEIEKIRLALRSEGPGSEQIAACFALVREVATRLLGQRHYDVQIMGGLVLLKGMVAEMEAGEGKTLMATLAATTAALSGIPVHIITVNDYLARRDAGLMRPLYEAFGLTTGIVVHGQSLTERRQAYHCDITYCSNKEIVFDYLKDRILFGRKSGRLQMQLERLAGTGSRIDRVLLRGLPFAIVDEADSVLIDEARTPLIISGPGNSTRQKEVYQLALDLAARLDQGRDFTMEPHHRSVELTEHGRSRIAAFAMEHGGLWGSAHWREHLLVQALSAICFFHKDREYILRDGKVMIVDEYTGRVMADRSWEQGLHQMIEAKEGCELSVQNETVARISYQRFFRRYCHLAGMTGTAREVAAELWTVYRLRVVSIPTNRPLIRFALPFACFRTAVEKWAAIVSRIRELHENGRPVLVGTRSVAVSEHLGSLLEAEGLPHQVLNARQDSAEADVIARAGRAGHITVATNMAGRGTDIMLSEDSRQRGGLHVIATELHDSRRIDRQLFGRCGRQGDPGSYEAVVSLEDDIFTSHGRGGLRWLAVRLGVSATAAGRGICRFHAAMCQWKVQRNHQFVRKELLKFDESLENAMAFTGRGE